MADRTRHVGGFAADTIVQVGPEDSGALVTLTAAGASGQSADQVNAGFYGVKVVIDITAITGAGATLTVRIEGRDLASGKYFTMLSSAGLTAVGTTVLTVYPGLTNAANLVANDVLPKTWRVSYTIAGTTPSVTAKIGVHKLY